MAMQLVYANEPKLYRILAVLAFLFWTVLILGAMGVALVWLLFFHRLSLYTLRFHRLHPRNRCKTIKESAPRVIRSIPGMLQKS